MDVENMLEAEDKLNSTILLDGNYFIMDSEQLVSNPFAELQQEAVQQAEQNQGKKNSMTERLTSVKNNVCEKHFLMASSRLEREKTSRLKQLHDHANKLRHQVKLLDLDKQRHQVEIKRRVEPDKDHSYDEAQVTNTEKRLGANIASYYLEKRLKYPVRIRSVSDISLTPTIQRARTSLRQNELKKSSTTYSAGAGDSGDHGNTASRAQTAKSISSSLHSSGQSQTSGPPRSSFRRRDSRSAPLYASSKRHGSGIRRDVGQSGKGSVLPAISSAQRRSVGVVGSRSATGKHGSNSETQHAPPVVKFAFENPLKILASNEESAKLFAQTHAAYYPGATRALNVHTSNPYGFSDTSDEDDDEEGGVLPDHINLRAMFFNKEQGENTNRAKVGNITNGQHTFYHSDTGIGNCGVGLTPHQLALLRKAQGPPPRLTTDMMQGELDKINTKVKTFMNSITHNSSPQQTYTSRKLSLLEDVSNKMNTTTTITITDLSDEKAGDRKILPKFSSKGTSTSDTATASENINPLPARVVDQSKQGQTDVSKIASDGTDDNYKETSDPKYKNEQALKYNWRLIRGREHLNRPDNDGEVRSATNVRPEDLVLQALTGIPINNALQTHVPLHSASRALRHTATFKMHKVVERLISERTKYQRHQVDQLKRQMSLDAGQGDTDVVSLLAMEPGDTSSTHGTGASGNKTDNGRLNTRKISQVSMGSGGPDRKLAAR